jgi:hypothetical protein
MSYASELVGIGQYQAQQKALDRMDRQPTPTITPTRRGGLPRTVRPERPPSRATGGIRQAAPPQFGGEQEPEYDEAKIARLERVADIADSLVRGQQSARQLESKGDKAGARKAYKTNVQETNNALRGLYSDGDIGGASIAWNSSFYGASGKQAYGFREEERDGRRYMVPTDKEGMDIKNVPPISLTPVTTEQTKAGKAIYERYMGSETADAAIGGTGALALGEHWRKKGKSVNETIGMIEQKIAEIKAENPEATPEEVSEFLQMNADALTPKSTKAKAAKKKKPEKGRVAPGSGLVQIGEEGAEGSFAGAIKPKAKAQAGIAAAESQPAEAALRKALADKGIPTETIEAAVSRAYERGDFGPPEPSKEAVSTKSPTHAEKATAGLVGAAGVRLKAGIEATGRGIERLLTGDIKKDRPLIAGYVRSWSQLTESQKAETKKALRKLAKTGDDWAATQLEGLKQDGR